MKVYLSFGSNLGNREQLINRALALVEQRIGTLLRRSSFFYSAPWGYDSPNAFCNLCAVFETALPPEQILLLTQAIERELGRTHKTTDDGVYRDRPIDIDLLYYITDSGSSLHYKSATLTLPHPLIEQREFVRVPLEQVLK